MRYAACVEYDGSQFKGWQVQLNQRTVQQQVETAFSKVADHPVAVTTAGRTDTGVHATGQIIHFDSTAERSVRAWRMGVNRFLPSDVRVHWVCAVDSEFHARFSALRRSYRYILYNQSIKPGLLRQYVSHEYRPLDIALMRQAVQFFLGEHDFSSIRAAGCQAHTPIRTVHELQCYQNRHWFWFDVTANAFLQHMVRNIAGLLCKVGSGERSPEWIADVLEQRDRRKAAVTAPPNGLYLTHVQYDDGYALPASPDKMTFWGDE